MDDGVDVSDGPWLEPGGLLAQEPAMVQKVGVEAIQRYRVERLQLYAPSCGTTWLRTLRS